MKRFKKTLAFMMAVIMMISVINLPAKAAESVTLGFEQGAKRDDYSDYILYLTGLSTEQVNALGGGGIKVSDVNIDGVKSSAYGYNVGGKLVVIAGWSSFNQDATAATDIGRHFVTIPKGATIGDNQEYTVAEDLNILIDGAKAPKAVSNDFVSLGYNRSGTRANDYITYFTGLTKDQVNAISAGGINTLVQGDILLDGNVIQGPYLFNVGGEVAFIVNYNHIKAGATSAADITEDHTVTLRKGAKIGNYTVARDFTLKFNGSKVTPIYTADESAVLSIAANRTDLLMLKMEGVATPSADTDFEAVTSDSVYQYNGEASKLRMFYSKFDGIYAEVNGMSGKTAPDAGDIVTIKGLWKYLGNGKVYDFGITNYTWNGTAWEEGANVIATKAVLSIAANRTDLLMLAVEGITQPSEDVDFVAVDENSVYLYNDEPSPMRMFYSKFNGIYAETNGMSGKSVPDTGDTITIGGIWKYTGDGKYYDFGTSKYEWNGSKWVAYVEPVEGTPMTLTGVTSVKRANDWIFYFTPSFTVNQDDFTATKDWAFLGNYNKLIIDDGTNRNTAGGSEIYAFQSGNIGFTISPAQGLPAAPVTGTTVTFPAGLQLTYHGVVYEISKDIIFDYNGTQFVERIEYSEFSLSWGTDHKAQDELTRYFTYPLGATAEQAADMHQKYVTIYVDGTPVENGVEFYNDGGKLLLLFQYSKIESGATTAEAMQPHNIQIKAGTIIGRCKLMNDFNFYVNKTEIGEGSYKTYSEFALTWDSGAAQNTNNRYLIYPNGMTDEQLADAHGQYVTLYVDGNPVENGIQFWNLEGKILLIVNYAKLETGVTTAEELQPHNLQVKAGTIVNNCKLTSDFNFFVNKKELGAGMLPTYESISLGWGTGAAQDGTLKRYLFRPAGATAAQISDIHGQWVEAYVDGNMVTSCVQFYNDGGSLLMLLPYEKLESNIATAAALQPHSIVVKKGTIIGDYKLAEDYCISVDGTTVLNTATLTEINMNLSADSAAQDYYDAGKTNPAKRYLLYLDGLNATNITDMHTKLAKFTLDDTTRVVNGNVVYYNIKNNGTTITIILPYAAIEEGVTENAQFADKHIVTIKKGTIIADKYVVGKELAIQLNKNQITEYVAPDLVEPEVKDAVTVAVEGTVLTVGGTGTVKASDLTSVTAANITEIQIVGPCNIASQAFAGFTALQKVYFSNTVLTAASDAFSGCASGVKAIFVKGRSLTGGLANVENHEYYSFKILTLGSSYGEDTNNYIYTLAKNYYSNLPGRTAEDIAYDDIVVAELFSGGCPLSDRVLGIMGQPATTCYYEKWDENGAVIPTVPTGQLTGDLMKMALQDEYWDVVILMQSAEDSRNASSFLVSTAGNGVADIDTVINFAKANNKNHSGSKYMWLQTWSYNYKLNAPNNYLDAIGWEEQMRLDIAISMQTVVQERIDLGGLDGIVPAGASIEYLKKSFLNAEDPNYTSDKTSGTYNNGVYSNYFAIQRDTAHASIGLGRFTLGLTAFGYLADLTNAEIQTLAKECYPKNYEECEVSEKLEGEQAATSAYLQYDEYTKDCAPQAYSAAIKAIANPYQVTKIYKSGDATGDDKVDALDLIRYKKAQEGTGSIADAATADINMDGVVDAADLTALRDMFVWNKLQ